MPHALQIDTALTATRSPMTLALSYGRARAKRSHSDVGAARRRRKLTQ